MASKTVIRNGAFFLNRLSQPFLHQSPHSNYPHLFPSLSNFPTFPHFLQNDAESINKHSSQPFFYPCGLPYLPFFLPDGDASSSEEGMLLSTKRTFQPSILRRKRNHGYFARKATTGGRKVIARRIAKGRFRITA
ncbi:hypothetical protein Lal_00021104 [Lupinus albus]|nr:hypothetical protein Lal_00021104 [Lupinus albus]